jgi:RNA polymerase sigma factor (sigma-70 family)
MPETPDVPQPHHRGTAHAGRSANDDVRDRTLVVRVAAGDAEAFEELVRAHRPRLVRIAERIVDGGRAEDAVQNALLRAYEALRRGESPTHPAAWLGAITRNAAIDQHRRRGPIDPVAEPEHGVQAPSVAAIAESRAELRRVLGDVASLPDSERDALLMRAVSGAGHAEIGAELHVSPGQARQLLHRARQRLREVAAVLLPAWFALRVTQARAALAAVAAAPSESVVASKGFAVAVVAATSIGTGGAALHAQRHHAADAGSGGRATTASAPDQHASGRLTAEQSGASGAGTQTAAASAQAAQAAQDTPVKTTRTHGVGSSSGVQPLATNGSAHSDSGAAAGPPPHAPAPSPRPAANTASSGDGSGSRGSGRGDAAESSSSDGTPDPDGVHGHAGSGSGAAPAEAGSGSSGASSGSGSSGSGSSGSGSSGSGSSGSGSGSSGSGSSDEREDGEETESGDASDAQRHADGHERSAPLDGSSGHSSDVE